MRRRCSLCGKPYYRPPTDAVTLFLCGRCRRKRKAATQKATLMKKQADAILETLDALPSNPEVLGKKPSNPSEKDERAVEI